MIKDQAYIRFPAYKLPKLTFGLYQFIERCLKFIKNKKLF